jgi:phosphoglycolate phosphatase
MRPTVLLFDIDGTLVTTGGAGRRAMALAFERLHQRPDACDSFKMSGMTDRAIVRKGLEVIGVTPSEPAIDALIAAYIAGLYEEIPRVLESDYRLHPGMREAVETALGLEGFAVGLGTGNVRPGAKVKLERVKLYEQFTFGGFGCDAEDRTALILHGAEQGAARLGKALDECRVVVIGDTPKDVEAARGIGAQCIGVGTGSYSAEQLRLAGAEFAFDDFSAPGALKALLAGR